MIQFLRFGFIALFVLGATLVRAQNFSFGTLAGLAGVPGNADGAASDARFNAPAAVAVTSDGDVLVGEINNAALRKVSPLGAVTTVAAIGNGTLGIAVDAAGNAYVADFFSHVIRKVTPGGTVTIFAGQAGVPGNAEGAGAAARFNGPHGLAFDMAGNLYVTEELNHTVRKITPGGVVSTFAGLAGVAGSADGNNPVARFSRPAGIAVDGADNLYVADYYNRTVRKLSPGGTVTTLAGWAGNGGSADGTGSNARFAGPQGIAVDAAGNVFVAEYNYHTLRKVTPAGVVTTIGGQYGVAGSVGGIGTTARFIAPNGLAIDAAGNLHVADSGNHVIRKGTLLSPPIITAQPANQAVGAGQSGSFTVAATSTLAISYQWQRQLPGATGFEPLTNAGPYTGALTATLMITGASTAMGGEQYRCVLDNSSGSVVTSNAATLTVNAPPAITSAGSATFHVGTAGTFAIRATGAPAPTFTITGGTLPSWATLNPATGVLSGTPTTTTGSPFALTISATNGIGTAVQSFALTVQPPLVTPTITATSTARQVVTSGQALTLAIDASGSSPLSIQWRRNGRPISGATSPNYQIASASPGDGGYYQAVVTNPGGSVTSATMFVTIDYLQSQVITWGVESTVPAGLTTAVAISAGGSHVLALKSDGTVTGWGSSSDGRLSIPAGLNGVVAVAAGGAHSLALKSDGTVVAWGYNTSGQATVPASLSNVVAISAGGSHSLALKADGTVVAWGSDSAGQRTVPAGVSGVTAVSAGSAHSLALRADGGVIGWGEYASVPATVGSAVAIFAGNSNSSAVRSDGSVAVWGYSSSGVAYPPAGLTGVISVAQSYYQGIALKSDGTIVTWGENFNSPVALPPGLRSVVAISAGYSQRVALRDASNDQVPVIVNPPLSVAANQGQSVTLTVSATAGTAALNYQWYKAGVAITGATSSSLTLIGIVAADVSTYHVLVSNSLGAAGSSAASVALNAGPQVGATSGGRYPLIVGQNLTLTLSSAISPSATVQWRRNGLPIAGATARTLAITNASVAQGGYYQAVYNDGSGAVISAAIFVPVVPTATHLFVASAGSSNGETNVPAGLTSVLAVSARNSSTLALRADGTVAQWGGYYYSSSSSVPAGLGNVVAIANGGSSYYALKADGLITAWGDSYSSSQMTPPAGLVNVVAVAAGYGHALALKGDGTVVAWGSASGGATAVPAGLGNVIAVAAGSGFSLALRADGSVIGWGSNSNGQSSVPAGVSGVVAIAAGASFSIALKQDGTVVTWGASDYYGVTTMAPPAGLANVVAITAGDAHVFALKGSGSLVGWGSYGNNSFLPVVTAQSVFALAGGSSHTAFVRDASGDTVPVIASEPASVNAFTDQSVKLSVVASGGTATLTYQWRKGGVPITGATSATVTLLPATAATAGVYDVVITDQLGSVVSQPATVTVNSTLAITSNLVGRQAMLAGQNLTLTGTTAIPGPVTYQWLRNGQPIGGATAATLDLLNLNFRHGGAYQLVATNSIGPAASAPIFVGVAAGAQVRAWGGNSSGQSNVPATGLGDVIAVSAGGSHSLALKNDGTVVSWGSNANGQRNLPASVSDVVAIAAGSNYSMTLSASGVVTTWGGINFTPTEVGRAIAIAADSSSSYGAGPALALKTDGTVVSWDASGLRNDVPPGLGNVVAIAAGGSYRLALRADGSVVQWGYSGVVPANVTGIVAIAGGSDQNVALKADGTVVAWGTNNYYNQTAVPPGLANVVAIATGGSTNFALKADGTIVVWGNNGATAFGAAAAAPAHALSVSGAHALALRNGAGDFAPTIASVSPSQAVTAGQPIILSVVASGLPPPSYQWYRNGLVLSGANAATYQSTASTLTAGTYTVAVTNALGTVFSSGIVVTVNPTLNQRGLLTSSAHANTAPAMIYATFSIEGTASKQMLVRAVGPALAGFGVTNVIADPQLTITNAAGLVLAANDDWGGAANSAQISTTAAQVGAFALAAGSKDAAVLRSYSPGTYHARMNAGTGPAGASLLEIYDADSNPRTVYIGTTAFAGAGANVFVQGMLLAGAPAGRTYLIRALGPSLAAPGALADPQLAIFDSAGVALARNDDWNGAAALSAAAAGVGAMPLALDSKDAAVNFVPPAGGTYTVQVNGAGGSSGLVLVEIFEVDAQRATSVTPAVVSPPQDVNVLPGQPAKFNAIALGRPAPDYQWRKNGVAIAGATNPTLAIASVQPGDAAGYSVMVTNANGSIISPTATLSVVSQTASHAVLGNGYVAGATVTITNTLNYTGTATSLGWQVDLPAGWSYASGSAGQGDVRPAVGGIGTLEWAWTTPPPSPVVFSYTLNVPAGETGMKSLSASAIVRAGADPQTTTALPATLSVDAVPNVHSADTSPQDFRLGLIELTRVIELYNTRYGSQRTGCYALATVTTEDGFATDATRPATPSVTLSRYHSGDSNRDGRFSLFELTRVIELYNYRSGTTRTGQYHVQAGTEDGYAAGP